jgi:hypothetical protein
MLNRPHPNVCKVVKCVKKWDEVVNMTGIGFQLQSGIKNEWSAYPLRLECFCVLISYGIKLDGECGLYNGLVTSLAPI